MRSCRSASVPILVFEVTRLESEVAAAGNPELDGCPINHGKRIFPGLTHPGDQLGVIRRKVKLAAYVEPPQRDIWVYFRVWDVDDPFDQVYGPNGAPGDGVQPVAGVELIDNDESGPDNRMPSGEPDPAVGRYAAQTDDNGRAVVTIEVSMQPGNNYRAGASCLEDAIGEPQVTQTHADELCTSLHGDPPKFHRGGNAFSYRTPLYWSKMLTVWRKLHVETDSMMRPTFGQNTFEMDWSEPEQGPVSTQVRFEVDDPPADDSDTDDQQFLHGYAEVSDSAGNPLVVGRIVDYTTDEGIIDDLDFKDEVTINIPDCGGGISGLACLQGVQSGKAVLSDDDLSEEGTFAAQVWGCDGLYTGGPGALEPPDLSALEVRYRSAFIHPVHESGLSALGSLPFRRNQGFGVTDFYGKDLWDDVTAPGVRDLPKSTSAYWTVMVVSAWQAEANQDGDPDSELADPGTTLGICSHPDGNTKAHVLLPDSATGLAVVFKAISLGPAESERQERFTVAHEVGHTLGLPHTYEGEGPPVGLMDPKGPGQDLPFAGESLNRLRNYCGP